MQGENNGECRRMKLMNSVKRSELLTVWDRPTRMETYGGAPGCGLVRMTYLEWCERQVEAWKRRGVDCEVISKTNGDVCVHRCRKGRA